MRIGFDIDGVLADFNTPFIQLVKDVTGKDLFGEGFWPQTWNYPEAAGYTAEETSAVWNVIKEGDSFWRTLPPLPDMKVLKSWWYGPIADCPYHEIYFITSRIGKNVKLQTELWLAEHLGQYEQATVLISSEKGAVAKALQLDYYIDDRDKNIADVEAQSPSTAAFLLTQPWNRDARPKIRVDGLYDFLHCIDLDKSHLPAVA